MCGVCALACERKLGGEEEGELRGEKKPGRFAKLWPNRAFPYFIRKFLVFLFFPLFLWGKGKKQALD